MEVRDIPDMQELKRESDTNTSAERNPGGMTEERTKAQPMVKSRLQRLMGSLGSDKAAELLEHGQGESEDEALPNLCMGVASPRSVDQGNDLSSPVGLQERKKRRLAEQHNKSEQRRRQKINTKLDELQSMVPNSRSREKAAILLDVIEYIKGVQAQLHIMSAFLDCNYPIYQAPMAPYYQPMGTGVVGADFPATELAPAAGGLPAGEWYGTLGGVAMPGGSSGSGGDGGGVGGSESGWSLGESSTPLGAVVDNTASCYDSFF